MRVQLTFRQRRGAAMWPAALEIISLVVGSVLGLLLLVWLLSHLGYSKRVRAANPGVSARRQQIVDDAAAIARGVAPQLENVTLSKYPLLFKDGREKPVVTYALTLGKSVDAYYFPVEEYTLDLGADASQIPSAYLCDAINAIEQDPNEFTQTLKGLQVDLEASSEATKWVKVKGTARNTLRTLLEFAYPTRRFAAIPGARAEVYVRGYADGQYSDWHHPLLPGEYRFNQLEVCPAIRAYPNRPACLKVMMAHAS